MVLVSSFDFIRVVRSQMFRAFLADNIPDNLRSDAVDESDKFREFVFGDNQSRWTVYAVYEEWESCVLYRFDILV